MDLRLFAIDGDLIDFPSSHYMQGRSSTFKTLNEFKDKNLTIVVNWDNNSTEPYTKTIKEIINQSKKM